MLEEVCAGDVDRASFEGLSSTVSELFQVSPERVRTDHAMTAIERSGQCGKGQRVGTSH